MSGAPIRTQRLLLRQIEKGDEEPMSALFANWEIIRYLSSPPWPYRREDATAFIDSILNRTAPDAETLLAICREDAFLGCIGYRMRPAGNLQRGAGPNIGYWLGRPHWNRGYMTEAVRGLLGFLFAGSAVEAVYCGAFSDNHASLRVQEKAGFVRDGETMLFARPHGTERRHTNTILPRARFEAMAP